MSLASFSISSSGKTKSKSYVKYFFQKIKAFIFCYCLWIHSHFFFYSDSASACLINKLIVNWRRFFSQWEFWSSCTEAEILDGCNWSGSAAGLGSEMWAPHCGPLLFYWIYWMWSDRLQLGACFLSKQLHTEHKMQERCETFDPKTYTYYL